MTISEGSGGDVCLVQSLVHDLKDTWAKSHGIASDFLLYLAGDFEVPGPIAGEPAIADSGRNCVTLSWPKPLHSGDAPVLAYRVEAWRLGSEGGARWTELGISPTNAYDAFGLVTGADYRLRITPRNRHGWGEALVSSPLHIQLSSPVLPEFTRPLAGHIKALRGQDITIECQVRGEPNPTIRWALDSDPVPEGGEGDGRVSVSREGGLCRLALTGVREQDAGRYSCEATNAAGRVSTFVRLQVVTDPLLLHADTKLKRDATLPAGEFPPQFTMRLRDRRVQQTFPVRLTCQAVGSPEPSIAWARNGVPLQEDDRHSLVRSDDGFHTLELSSALLEDSGEYSATASSTLGSVTCRCELVVDKGIRAYLPPEFVAEVGPSEEVEVREGDDLYLFAIVEAYPSVGVVWHRDAVRLRQSQHTTATLDRDGRVELCVRKVTGRDAGVYTCTASNEVGRASSAARVRVVAAGKAASATLHLHDGSPSTTPPMDLPYSKEPAFIRKPRSFDVEEGDDVVIVCEVVGDPKPEVSWLRDWLKPDYYHHSPQFVIVGSGPEYRLEIPQVRLDFTGTYAILARNQHGEARAVISLQVYAKGQGMGDDSKCKTVKRGKEETLPSVVQPLQDLRCCDGDAVTLECRVDASPAPDVHWKKDGKLVRLSDNYQAELLEDGRARLRIHRVVAEDEGQYSCVAFNRLGRATTAGCLVIDVPEEKENLISSQLDRPNNLRSAGSTPRSSPRSTPRSTPSRSASPYIPRGGLREVAPLCPSLDRPRRTRPSAPRFYAVPHNRVAELGETVRFQCAVAGHPSPWARWDKDGAACTATAGVSISERDDVRVLEVRQVTLEDAGLYRVVVENDYGRVEATARLEVIGHRGARTQPLRAWSASPRSSPAFGRRPASQVSRVGGEVTLACDLDGSPAPVTNWYKDGDIVVRGSRVTPTWDGRVSRLTVRKLRASDAGVYTCVASNDAGETRCSAQLLVLDKGDPNDADRRPPVFVRGIAKHTDAVEGKPLELQVELRGSAPFQVVWLKNGVELPDCGDFRQLSLGDGRFALRMQDMFPEDTATYSCEAFNGHGEARTHGTVAVVDGAVRGMANTMSSATWTKTPLGVMSSTGASASFCARLSDPHNRPRKVTWSVAGRAVVPDNIKYQVVEDGNELLLHVRRVAAEDAGAVQCRVHACGARNPGQTCGAECFDLSCTADLIVIGDEPRDQRAASVDRAVPGSERSLERPAVLLRGPSDTTALRGERVQLTALYAGEPEPAVRWLRAGRELAADDRTSIRTAGGVSCLALQPVCADDTGKYVVSVENIYGADHHFASVAVEGPPDPPAGKPVALSDPSGGLCAVLTWSSPPYDGGRCVDGYVVEGKTESEAEWRVVAERCHSLSVVLRDLAPGRRHVFRVRAENVHGQSEPSAQSLPYCTPALTECVDEPPPPPFSPRLVSAEPLEGHAGFAARFSLLEELGKGRYGTVHRVTEHATGHTLAAKVIRTIKAKDRQQVHDEITIMNLLRHPKLLQLAAAFESPREMVMVMEYISGGELFERVVADDFTLTERDCILFMRQICEGVDYMHQNQVVHLDLKPENIMCQTRTSHQIKLIDFGLAQKLKPDTPVRVLFGTPEFIPPEIINYEPIGTESDMWSVGVICYVLLSGLSPFMGDNDAETFANITRADFDFDDEAFDAISQDARDFISSLLVKRKEKRLTARQCLEHSWLAQQPASMSCIALSTDKLKKFIIRRKWQKTGNAIRALGRMATLSAASRRNSAASSAASSASSSASPRHSVASPGSPSMPRAALGIVLGKEDSVEEEPALSSVLKDTVETAAVDPVGTAVDSVEATVASQETVDAVVAQEDDAGEEAVTATLVPRGRFCSERSDSGISDCSSASSRHRGDVQVLPAPATLFGKKFSISEEVDELACAEAPDSPVATRPTNFPLPLPPSASLANPGVPNIVSSSGHDGSSTDSRRSADVLHRLASNPTFHSSPAPAAATAAEPPAPAALERDVAAAGAAGPAGQPPRAAAGLSSPRAGRGSNGPRSPTKTRPPVGFVESKIKSLENKVSVTVEPPRERVSLRDTWTGTGSPGRTATSSRKDLLALSPSRRVTALSPSRRETALSPSRRETALSPSRRETALSPSRRVTALSPSRREMTLSPSRRLAASSPTRMETPVSPSRRAGTAPSPTSPVGSPSSQRPSRLHPVTTSSTPPPPRKAPLDTGLGLIRRTPPTNVYDSPPKSPTLRRMVGPNKLGTHSAGFQKTLEFWKR